MVAPSGNQFWKNRSKHGRNTLFETPALLLETAQEYFEWCDSNPLKEEKIFCFQGDIIKDEITLKRVYTISGLCVYIGCSSSYFRNFKTENQDFLTVLDYIRETIYTQKFEGASVGLFNASIIARDLGLKESVDNDHRSSDGSMSPKGGAVIVSSDPIEAAKEYKKIMSDD